VIDTTRRFPNGPTTVRTPFAVATSRARVASCLVAKRCKTEKFLLLRFSVNDVETLVFSILLLRFPENEVTPRENKFAALQT
jgi:hypothetical protein